MNTVDLVLSDINNQGDFAESIIAKGKTNGVQQIKNEYRITTADAEKVFNKLLEK